MLDEKDEQSGKYGDLKEKTKTLREDILPKLRKDMPDKDAEARKNLFPNKKST